MNKKLLIIKKQEENKKYINDHIKNVQRAWIEVQEKCKNTLDELLGGYSDVIIKMVDDEILYHDESKFSEEEFEAYRKNFFPIDEEEKKQNEEDFKNALNHHYMNNTHHWNYWYLTNRMDDMYITDIVHMICDWQGMGYKFGNNALQYYEKNKEEIKLGTTQRKYLEILLHALCD